MDTFTILRVLIFFHFTLVKVSMDTFTRAEVLDFCHFTMVRVSMVTFTSASVSNFLENSDDVNMKGGVSETLSKMAVLVLYLPPYRTGISGKMSLRFPTINTRDGPPCTVDEQTH